MGREKKERRKLSKEMMVMLSLFGLVMPGGILLTLGLIAIDRLEKKRERGKLAPLPEVYGR